MRVACKAILSYVLHLNATQQQDTNNMNSTLDKVSDCILLLPLMKEAVKPHLVWVGFAALWVNSRQVSVGHSPFVPLDSRRGRWMPRQDRPAECQLVKNPAALPCHRHTPHTHVLPITSHHRTLTSHTIFIPSFLPCMFQRTYFKLHVLLYH